MLHNSRSISAAIVAYMRASGADLGKNSYYAQLAAAGQLGEFIPELKEVALFAGAKLRETVICCLAGGARSKSMHASP